MGQLVKKSLKVCATCKFYDCDVRIHPNDVEIDRMSSKCIKHSNYNTSYGSSCTMWELKEKIKV